MQLQQTVYFGRDTICATQGVACLDILQRKVWHVLKIAK